MKRGHFGITDNMSSSSGDDSGEDLMGNAETDYVAIPELDKYEDSVLDNRHYATIDAAARHKAEALISVNCYQYEFMAYINL